MFLSPFSRQSVQDVSHGHSFDPQFFMVWRFEGLVYFDWASTESVDPSSHHQRQIDSLVTPHIA